ncbi:hypothetical protein OOJ91_12470 [Micromonospora lupini]|uniref:hypothetical protein n=1 Tax=Micromonospora lupini TaxID=285679 RepID=UPI002255B650|nr:hypothetical protein [Micromonospora lupini]MCX5066694.1 hypothetical protein [Micromonospora lupini]
MTDHPYDPDCCTFDPDGNPEDCIGPPREEPDCWECSDSRTVRGWFGRRRSCPNCSPSRGDLVRARLRGLVRRRPARGGDVEPPF